MKNKGSTTIFLCLMVSAMVVLGIAAIKAVSYRLAEGKGAIAVKSAMSSVDAGYNSYIFENYHILLFDRCCNGKGEAYLEEQLIQDLKYNLGDSFEVEELGVNDYELLLENDCNAFKKQIADYCGYALIEEGASAILDSTGGLDGTVSQSIYDDMDAAENTVASSSQDSGTSGKDDVEDDEPQEGLTISLDDTDDPRDFTEDLSSEGILAIVAPEGLQVSSEIVELYGVPSIEKNGYDFFDYEIDNDFDDMDSLKKDMGVYDSWKDKLLGGGAALMYATGVFNSAIDTVQENTRFSFELEYIICGRASDLENLKGTVHRIIGIRFPVNYAYLLSDTSRMAQITKLSWPIALATLVPEPVVRYLIAGCWAYVESIFDTRCLMEGQKQPFFKTNATWKTDLNDLENSVNLEGVEDEHGLQYKDYLMILMGMDMEKTYYRMLDVIELNTKCKYPDFDMNNAVVGFSVDAKILYEGRNFYYKEKIGY